MPKITGLPDAFCNSWQPTAADSLSGYFVRATASELRDNPQRSAELRTRTGCAIAATNTGQSWPTGRLAERHAPSSTGFREASAFHRAFKQGTGENPAHDRRQWHSNGLRADGRPPKWWPPAGPHPNGVDRANWKTAGQIVDNRPPASCRKWPPPTTRGCRSARYGGALGCRHCHLHSPGRLSSHLHCRQFLIIQLTCRYFLSNFRPKSQMC